MTLKTWLAKTWLASVLGAATLGLVLQSELRNLQPQCLPQPHGHK